MFSKAFDVIWRLLLWILAITMLSFCISNKSEAVVGSLVVAIKPTVRKPPSNCFNNHICLKFDYRRRCVYWAKDSKGMFIKCYVIRRK